MPQRKVKVGTIKDVSGEVTIAGGDIIKNIKTIYQRALTAAEEAASNREIEGKLLAQGVSQLAQSISLQASQPSGRASPYKGLLAYNLNEAQIFYGRSEAKTELLNCIKQDPLTVLHAESGAGKSSLLQAGIAAQLITEGHLAIRLRSHNSDPIEFIKRTFMPDLTQTPVLAKASLREFLRQVCAVLGSKCTIYFLLDQFEEFFDLLKKDEHKPFLESLADCLNDSSLNVRWVLAIRAEALSDLAELESFGITPFKNIYHLNRLSRTEAQEAITEPAKRYNITFEPGLIEHILDSLTTDNEITPTQLQLVCFALTDDLPPDKNLTLIYYIEHEGGTEGILRDYLKRQLEHLPFEEQTSAWKVLRALITADRHRAVKRYDEIVEELKLSGVSKEQIDTILARLVERRLLTTQPAVVETFELAHDYLVKEIELDPQEQARKAAQELLDQETRTYQRYGTLLTAERLKVIEPHRGELRFTDAAEKLFNKSQQVLQAELLAVARRRTRILVISIISAIAMTILAFWGWRSSQEATSQKEEAQRQAKIARAGELDAQAINHLEDQHDLSLLLSVEAFHGYHPYSHRNGLTTSLQASSSLTTYLHGHSGRINAVVFNPEEKTFASYGEDGIILWDVSDPSFPVQLGMSHIDNSDLVISAAFRPDSKILAAGNNQGNIVLWNVSNPNSPIQLARPRSANTGSVNSITFSRDGQTLASSSCNVVYIGKDIVCDQGDISLWNVFDPENPSLLGSPITGLKNGILSVAISPNGKMLAAGSCGKENTINVLCTQGEILLWDISNPSIPRQLDTSLIGHTNYVMSLAFSPDGKTLASGSRDGTIILWDFSNSTTPIQLGPALTGHTDMIVSLAFSPDSKILASGSRDNSITLWNISNSVFPAKFIKRLIGHTNTVQSLSFSPNGKMLASASNDSTVILWNIVDQSSSLQFGQPLTGPTDWVGSVSFSSDNATLASGSRDGTIRFWDISNPTMPVLLSKESVGPAGTWVRVAYSPNRKVLASGNSDGTITLWNVSNPSRPFQLGRSISGHKTAVFDVAFSPDGQFLVSGSSDATIILWDVRNLSNPVKLATLSGHSGVIYGLAFSPEGKLIASGGSDDTIILWDVSNPTAPVKLGRPLTNHKGYVTSVAFSPDGKTLISASYDRTILIWDVSDPGAPVLNGTLVTGSKDYVLSIGFSPDSKTLAAGNRDGTIILWDISNPNNTPARLGQPLIGHTDAVMHIKFSPNSKILASGSRDGTIILWDVDPERWVNLACQKAGRNLSRAEWSYYIPDKPYPTKQEDATCPQWPLQ